MERESLENLSQAESESGDRRTGCGDHMAELFSHVERRIADPMVSALFKTMIEQKATREEISDEVHRLKQLLVQADRAMRHVDRLRQNAEAKLTYLAEVFGACRSCWGQDPSCELCMGKGMPGNESPIRADLLVLTRPALRRVGLDVTEISQNGRLNSSLSSHDKVGR